LARVPREYFEEAEVRLGVVGCAPFKFIKGFKEKTGFGYDLYSDSDRTVYQALGLKTTLSSQGAGSIHVKSSSLKGTLSSTWQALKGLKKQGDFSQQGGSFIIDPDGKILYSHLDQGTLDHVPINELLEKAGVKTVDFSAIHSRN
jgi:peroxiredoxin